MTTDSRAGPDPTPCRVGLWGVFDVEDFGQAVYRQVLGAELARRLPAARLRVFSAGGAGRPTRADRGEPAEPLGRWSPGRATELAERLDFVVVGGSRLAPSGGPGAAGDGDRFLVEGPGPGGDVAPGVRWNVVDRADEVALRRAGVAGDIDVTPHPVVLLPRLIAREVLDKRLEFLRVMGWYPREGGGLVVQGDEALVPLVPRVVGSLRQVLDAQPGLSPVLVELHHDDGDAHFAGALAAALGGRVRRLPAAASQEDVAAAIAASSAFVGSSPVGCLAALAYGRPSVRTDGAAAEHDGLEKALAVALKSGAPERLLVRQQAELDAFFDTVARAAAAAARARHRGHPPDPARPALEAELRALRRAHRARSERANVERALLADRVVETEADLGATVGELDELRRRAERESEARARYEAECDALRQTRTFRWTAAARRVYGKLNRGRR